MIRIHKKKTEVLRFKRSFGLKNTYRYDIRGLKFVRQDESLNEEDSKDTTIVLKHFEERMKKKISNKAAEEKKPRNR